MTTPLADTDSAPLRVRVQEGMTGPLRQFCLRHQAQLLPADSPESAEVILYDNDIPEFVRSTPEFQRWPQKCVVVSEHDIPTYYLPACYASNRDCRLSRGRTQTIPFFLSQMTHPNPRLHDPSWKEQRRYLYAFLGGSTSWVRKKLFRMQNLPPDAIIQPTDHYEHWNDSEAYKESKRKMQEHYATVLHDTWFFLCPRGAGVSSIRLFEIMQAGIAPVILADNWVPPADVPWNEFALFLPESGLDRLDRIVRSHANEAAERGRRARAAWEKHFAPGADALTLTRALRRIQRMRDESRERRIRALFPVVQGFRSTLRGGKKMARNLVLTLMGKRFPYRLNRPHHSKS